MELEEQLRTVTAQRRKAERAAAEVLAQGFGPLSFSDAGNDSGSEDEVGTGDSVQQHLRCNNFFSNFAVALHLLQILGILNQRNNWREDTY